MLLSASVDALETRLLEGYSYFRKAIYIYTTTSSCLVLFKDSTRGIAMKVLFVIENAKTLPKMPQFEVERRVQQPGRNLRMLGYM